MSAWFEVRGRMAPKQDRPGSIKASWSDPLFEGMQCWNMGLGGGLRVVCFYPETEDVRKRLAALEADPSPIIGGLEGRWQSGEWRRENHPERAPDPRPDFRPSQLPEMLRQLRAFVKCYEKAFAQKTEWEPAPHRDPTGGPPSDELPNALRRHREPYILRG